MRGCHSTNPCPVHVWVKHESSHRGLLCTAGVCQCVRKTHGNFSERKPHSCHIIVCMYKLHVLHFRWWQMYSRSGLHTFIKSQKINVWHKFLSRVIYHYIPLHLKKVLETRWLSLEAYKKLLGKLLCVAQFKCSCIDSFLSRTFEFMFIILSLMNSARNVFLDFFSPPAVQWARQQGSGC